MDEHDRRIITAQNQYEIAMRTPRKVKAEEIAKKYSLSEKEMEEAIELDHELDEDIDILLKGNAAFVKGGHGR